MLKLLRPDLYLESVHRLDLDALQRRGIRGLILDIDNTLVPWNDPDAPDSLRAWLTRVRARGLAVCLVSNNTRQRVAAFAAVTGIPYVSEGRKPAVRVYRAALRALGTTPAETAALGDQIYPDVYGAKRMGIYSVLVSPLCEREFVGTRIKRLLERPLLRAMIRRGLIRPE